LVAGSLGAYGYGIDDEEMGPVGADDTDALGRF
jgi:hypothetical protein